MGSLAACTVFYSWQSPSTEGPLKTAIRFEPFCLERQSMTDRALDISAALREAQLQHLEASLAAKAAEKPARTNATPTASGSTRAQDPASGH